MHPMAWHAPDGLMVGVGYTENWQVFLQNPTAPLRPQLWEGHARGFCGSWMIGLEDAQGAG